MEERTRLGRGLEEVSQFYLSERPRETADKKPRPDVQERPRETAEKKTRPDVQEQPRRIVRIFCPCSALLKSCFLANLALELARNRVPVTVWDGFGNDKAGVGLMLQQLILPDLTPDAGTVRLYGLPDILVYDAGKQGSEKLRELADAAVSDAGHGCLFISAPDSLESILQSDTVFDAVMLSGSDRSSLLQCYAYIKVIREHDPFSRISLLLDDPESDAHAFELFSRLSGFVRERLQSDVDFLGILIHDELLERSIEEHRPLVLRHEQSAAKDNLSAIAEAFMESAQLSGLKAGGR